MFSDREAAFPLNLADQALTIELQNAQASFEDDRVRILNKITNSDLDATPVEEHKNFDNLNHSLRANFALSSLTGVKILSRIAVVKSVYFVLCLFLRCSEPRNRAGVPRQHLKG